LDDGIGHRRWEVVARPIHHPLAPADQPGGSARTLHAAAEANKEVLAESGQLLDQFEPAVRQGTEGRAARKGAVLELKTVATLISRTVRVMDARNRQRFQDDPPSLGAWLSAKEVLGNGTGPARSSRPRRAGHRPAGM